MFRSWSTAIFAAGLLAGCGGSDGSVPVLPPVSGGQCTVDAQKQFVLDAMVDVYFWNDLLPSNVDLEAYATADELLADLISVQPLDNFSYIDSLASDSQFFEEGRFDGFGFSSEFIAADDLRLLRVFASSPAADAGLARGQQIVMLNGRTVADIERNEGIDAVFDLPTLEFHMRRPDGSEFVASIDRGPVTIDPVPLVRVIPLSGGTSVGYLELATFIGTANDPLTTAFAQFAAAGVTDVILDLRYNGGGRVDTTEHLGDLLGGVANAAAVFSQTRFNTNNAASNRIATFADPGNSIILSRLVVIATERTASASELLTNSMFPYADVTIVGGTTRGKPVGQLGLQFCDRILRATAFETLNANAEGGYFDGLQVDCPVADDLAIPVGDAADPNLQAAIFLLENGACPTSPVVVGIERNTDLAKTLYRRSGSTARSLAGAM